MKKVWFTREEDEVRAVDLWELALEWQEDEGGGGPAPYRV